MKRLRSLLILTAATLSLSSVANAVVITYTLEGTGNFTGSLAGNPFIATSFSISGSADSSTIQIGALPGTFATQAIEITAPVMTINTTSGPINITMVPDGGNSLYAFTYDIASVFSAYGFGSMVPFSSLSSGIMFAVFPPDSIDLGTPATYYGDMVANTGVNTSGGTLNLNMASVPSSFTISAVPEPATATSSLLLSLGGLSLISRRNRKA